MWRLCARVRSRQRQHRREFVSLEDAEAEQQGKKPAAAEGAAAGEEEEVEIDESLDDAAFIEEQEEGDADVSDIIGETVEKEEET